MCEVLLLGSFHFHQTALDVLSEKNQRSLAQLNESLAAFAPDAVCVEAGIKSQETVDSLYCKLDPIVFEKIERMRDAALGEIEAYGQRVSATYNNEIIQIGFRLGKQLKHERVYAIDDELSIADEGLCFIPGVRKQRWEEGIAQARYVSSGDLMADLRFLNQSVWTEENHRRLYVEACRLGGYPDYAGARMTASWYERNLRIFSNLCSVAETHKRVFVVYGAGHLKLLREWIDTCDGLTLHPAVPYLEMDE